nr:MAG TPA: hypothetical protein [Caudoviricetes sp.]DAY68351.1 MAG TPA: hypothetical protein [Caudoviricetes sp.]
MRMNLGNTSTFKAKALHWQALHFYLSNNNQYQSLTNNQ